MLFRRRSSTTADPAMSIDELRAEIERLTQANREARDADIEGRLIQLRHLAGIELLDSPLAAPQHPEPAFADLPEAAGLPELTRDQLSPGLLRAGILRDG